VTDKGNLALELHQRRHDIATILSEKKWYRKRGAGT
jgi:hypothetical protein